VQVPALSLPLTTDQVRSRSKHPPRAWESPGKSATILRRKVISELELYSETGEFPITWPDIAKIELWV
jgi:hypothetical protein